MPTFLRISSLSLFLLSLSVHIATYIPGVPLRMSFTWPIHVVTIGMFAAMIFSARKRQAELREYSWNVFRSVILDRAPKWAVITWYCSIVYVIINFLVFMVLVKDGSPKEENGKFYLVDHGRVTRQITKQEHQQYEAYVVRGFSGHWILFTILPALYFRYSGEPQNFPECNDEHDNIED